MQLITKYLLYTKIIGNCKLKFPIIAEWKSHCSHSKIPYPYIKSTTTYI